MKPAWKSRFPRTSHTWLPTGIWRRFNLRHLVCWLLTWDRIIRPQQKADIAPRSSLSSILTVTRLTLIVDGSIFLEARIGIKGRTAPADLIITTALDTKNFTDFFPFSTNNTYTELAVSRIVGDLLLVYRNGVPFLADQLAISELDDLNHVFALIYHNRISSWAAPIEPPANLHVFMADLSELQCTCLHCLSFPRRFR